MKNWLKKKRDSVRQDFKDGKDILFALLSFPVVFGAVVLLFVIGIIADVKGINPMLGTLELIGMAIIAALLAVILMCMEKPRTYIGKIFIFSLLWFASCLVLVDFSEFSLELFLRIITAFEFIFLGCLLPDLVAEMKEIKEQKKGR